MVRPRALARMSVLALGLWAASCGGSAKDADRRRSACGDLAALGESQLTEGRRLCEHQALVAALTPAKRLVVPFRVALSERTQFCVRDDDGEPHRVRIVQDGVAQVDVVNGQCAPAVLAAGDYDLEITHGRAGEVDPAPDIVHTFYRAAGDASGTRAQGVAPAATWTLVTNEYHGDLSDAEVPMLAPAFALCGYAGDYQGATLSHVPASGCRNLTYGHRSAAQNDFDGATVDPGEVWAAGQAEDKQWGAMLPIGPGDGTPAGSFRGATFSGLKIWADVTYLTGDFHGAHFASTHFHGFPTNELRLFGPLFPTWSPSTTNDFTGLDLAGATADRLFPTGIVESPYLLASAVTDVGTLRAFDAMVAATAPGTKVTAFEQDTIVYVGAADLATGLAGGVFDGDVYHWRWPADAVGNVALAGANFTGATVANMTFFCAGLGKGGLQGARFRGATLTGVNMRLCDLSAPAASTGAPDAGAGGPTSGPGLGCNAAAVTGGADFTGATIRAVAIEDGVLDGVTFAGATIDGLDVAGASLVPVVFSTPGAVPAANAVNMARSSDRPTTAQIVVGEGGLSATNWDFTGAILSDSCFQGAQLSAVDPTPSSPGAHTIFSSARLDRVDFRNAALDKVKFDYSQGTGAQFGGASLRAANASNAKWSTPYLDGAHAQNAVFVGAIVCNASAKATELQGADLNGALFPRQGDTYAYVDPAQGTAVQVACDGWTNGNDATGPITDATTRCPSGAFGPCSGDDPLTDGWVPKPAFAPRCPKAWVHRAARGEACTDACGCQSQSCNTAGTCD